MKKTILNILKILIPVALGIFLIWYIYKDLSQDEKDNIFKSFVEANYFWIMLSVICGVFSHFSRAYRWKYMLEPMGYRPRFWNSFFSVMIGYIANLAFPRLGEATRCGVMTKYEKIPFDKLFGTVIAERAADLAILLSITFFTIVFQFNLLKEKTAELVGAFSDKLNTNTLIFLAIGGVLFILAIVIVFRLANSSSFIQKLKLLMLGLVEGVRSIFRMEKLGKFLLHTGFIWGLYIFMFCVCFYTLPETADVSIGGMMATFVFSSYAIVLVQGGIGVYPIIIMETLIIYGITKSSGFALGWIIWTSQTLMIIALGVISIILVPLCNKKNPLNDPA